MFRQVNIENYIDKYSIDRQLYMEKYVQTGIYKDIQTSIDEKKNVFQKYFSKIQNGQVWNRIDKYAIQRRVEEII